MRRYWSAILVTASLLSGAAFAQDHSEHAHQNGGQGTDANMPALAPEEAIPPRAFEGPTHAADLFYPAPIMAKSRALLGREHGDHKMASFIAERFETGVPTRGGSAAYIWDVQGAYGGDLSHIVIESEGHGTYAHKLETADVQLLYSRAISPFFDIRAGVRYDIEPEGRAQLAAGIKGLAPGMIEVDFGTFVSSRGDVSARVKAAYDQKITQTLVLQPMVEAKVFVQDIADAHIGAGLNAIETSLRLRYEIRREFAPYIGVTYDQKFGRSADFARQDNEDTHVVRVLAGIRFWF